MFGIDAGPTCHWLIFGSGNSDTMVTLISLVSNLNKKNN